MGKEIFVVGDNEDVKIEKFLKNLGFSYLTCILQLGDIVQIFAVVQPKIDKKVISTKKHQEIDKNIAAIV